ncbi:hypothetical protein [Xanthomonas phage f20-Xaj]|uniref:Uncharacterized protein n=2 Tax=Pradovirus TaxID=1985733 RepID=A0A127AVM2_9CAUD|nr:hypothetical protein FDI07_gp13 [Xanthomonas phage f20-Xaj]YP_009276341.1 hypothetical protein FDI08_gp40 [Xanthomonas phage f30-Xaj]AMM44664.1 hypothetical protein [Xanthomonas phage f20-Xaj]AMM44706.1 hypothetical protein [Xanthomonas phage f30-Xaj]
MKKIKAFLLGMYEFRMGYTWSDPARNYDSGLSYTELDEAYDWGREWAHRLTFRRWDY